MMGKTEQMSNFEILENNKAVLHYNLTSNDVDGYSQTRIHTYENLVQEAAGLHAHYRRLGIYDLQKENKTWVIARSRMEIYRYGMWPEEIKVTTWPLDSTGFNCPRHVEAAEENGEKLFSCETKWAIIDFTTGRPLRASQIADRLKTPPKEEQGESRLPSLVDEEKNAQCIISRYIPHIHYLDTDLNKHVNNLSYITWCLEALPNDFRDAYKPSLVDVRWIRQCYRHDNLSVVVRAADGNELTKDEPGLWYDFFRTEESGAQTKVFEAWMKWKKREDMLLKK